MGVEKFRRPLLMMQGFDTTASSTISDTLTVSGAITASGGLTLTGMTAGEYLTEYVQTLTGAASLSDASTGGTAILGYGITKITIGGASQSTAANFIFKLDSPIAAGVEKVILVAGNTSSTKEVSIRTATSTHVFFGSTKNSVTWSTLTFGSPSATILRGLSTSQWALVHPLVYTSTATATPWSIAGATA